MSLSFLPEWRFKLELVDCKWQKLFSILFFVARTFGTRGHQCPTLQNTQSLRSSALVAGALENTTQKIPCMKEWSNSRSTASITMYLPKHHRAPSLIYYATMWIFGLEPTDESVTKDKHRLHSTLSRSVHFGGNIGERARNTNKSWSRFLLVYIWGHILSNSWSHRGDWFTVQYKHAVIPL